MFWLKRTINFSFYSYFSVIEPLKVHNKTRNTIKEQMFDNKSEYKP